MLEQFLAIARNTFFESIRQPIMLVMLLVGALLITCSNLLSGFTMEDDQKMYIDLGLATVFLFGTLLSAMIATSVLTREIDNRTALTVVSKPVPRALYVLGKYAGVVVAMMVGVLFLGFVFMLVERHQVLQTVRDPLHWPVIIFGISSALIGIAVGVWSNYFYNKAFPSTFISVTTFLLGLSYIVSLMLDDSFGWQDPERAFRPQLWYALMVLLIAVMIITAVAIAASTRFGQVLTLVFTIGIFVLGLLSDAFFGRTANSLESRWAERVESLPVDAVRGPDLTGFQPGVDIDDLRDWTRTVLVEEATTDRRVAVLELDRSLEIERRTDELDDFVDADDDSTAEFEAGLQRRRDQELSSIDASYESALSDIDDLVNAIESPVDVSQLSYRIRKPQIFRMDSGEVSVESSVKPVLVAYPAATRFVSTGSERALHAGCRVAYAIVPNFQTMLLADAVTQGHVIPGEYVLTTVGYGGAQVILFLMIAVMLFQQREVG